MNYKSILKQMKNNKIYSRKQVCDFVLKDKPNLSVNSLKWIISDMVKKSVLYKVQRGKYSLTNTKTNLKQYVPILNHDLAEISKIINHKYPLINYVCFESIQLNEFLNQLIAKNTFFIYVEKEASKAVLRYLQENGITNILYKPNIKEYDSYWRENTIIILDLISEYPRNKYDAHVISIEHLLVDLISEKCITYLYSKSEINYIYRTISKLYMVDYSRLYRYARRRNKEETVKKIVRGVYDA